MWKKSRNTQAIYIPGWRYIRRSVYPSNKHDTCGYTAACLLLNYYHNHPGTLCGKVIPREFFGHQGKLLTEGYTLQDKLLQYTAKNLSWGGEVAKVLNRYFEEFHIPAKAHFRILGFGARSKVKKGTPVILFGNLPVGREHTKEFFNRLNHAVVAYGLNYSNGVLPHYIVHYGWKNREYNVLLNDVIGSYCYITAKEG